MTFQPLLVTGTARGGTTLLARLLDAHPQAAVALDPYFPLFRSLRDALLRAAGIETLSPSAPIQDYYFADERIRMLDAVQAGGLDVPLEPAEVERLRAATAARASVEAPSLVPAAEQLAGATYRELFDSALQAVARGRPGARYAGSKEVWTVEFVAPLARAYPAARFVAIVRDPRGVLASLDALAAADPSQAAHPLSYARHWRKQVAFLERYRQDPVLADRVYTLRYEDLVGDPEREARALFGWLELPFDPGVLDLAWAGNSSFQERTAGIDSAPAERWRQALDPALLGLAELVCRPELELAGYEPATAGGPDQAVLAHLEESDRRPASWRSDLGDPVLDYRLEVERAPLLEAADPDPAAVRRAFLFREAFAALRARVLAHAG